MDNNMENGISELVPNSSWNSLCSLLTNPLEKDMGPSFIIQLWLKNQDRIGFIDLVGNQSSKRKAKNLKSAVDNPFIGFVLSGLISFNSISTFVGYLISKLSL